MKCGYLKYFKNKCMPGPNYHVKETSPVLDPITLLPPSNMTIGMTTSSSSEEWEKKENLMIATSSTPPNLNLQKLNAKVPPLHLELTTPPAITMEKSMSSEETEEEDMKTVYLKTFGSST